MNRSVVVKEENKGYFGPIMFSLWLLSVLANSLITRFFLRGENGAVMILLFVGLVWPLVLFLFSRQFKCVIPRLLVDRPMLFFLFLYGICNFLSIFKSAEPFISLGYLASILIGIILAYSFSSSLDDNEMALGLVIYGVFASVILVVYASYLGTDIFGRLNSDGLLNPNSLGMIAVSAIMAGFLSRRKLILFLAIIPSGYVLMQSSSRASMLGLIVGLIVWILAKKKRKINYRTMSLYCFLLVAVVLTFAIYNRNINNFIEGIFYLHDRYRGLYSGASGRFEAWSEAWSIFLSSPVIGVGYRMHELYMTFTSSAHNGFLSILADTGIMGIIPVFYLIYKSFKGYIMSVRNTFAPWAISVLTAYFCVGMFERYLLNIGNSMSLLVIVLFVRGLGYKVKMLDRDEDPLNEKIVISRCT